MSARDSVLADRAELVPVLMELLGGDIETAGFDLVTVFTRGTDHYAVRPSAGQPWVPVDGTHPVAQAIAAFGHQRALNASGLFGVRACRTGVQRLEPLPGRLDDPLFAHLAA